METIKPDCLLYGDGDDDDDDGDDDGDGDPSDMILLKSFQQRAIILNTARKLAKFHKTLHIMLKAIFLQ